MTPDEQLKKVQNQMCERLIQEGCTPESVEPLRHLPLRTDGGPEVMKRRLEWLAYISSL